ncbi:MAG TPA: fatty acid desaturase [Polyangiales bacterium]
MASLISPTRLTTARINQQAITVEPRETLLQAALRQGIDFPNSCRVGGCGTCKCRLTTGKVKELTETGYLLSAEELDQGYILACQSVPQSDLDVEVDLARASARGVAGRVIEQQRVTRDITRLTVQLAKALNYQAGQFANLSIEGLPGVVRSYSFATPARADGQVSFFVRKVPGGQLSSLLNDEDVLGRRVHVEGPFGDFWLRDHDAPLLLVAGGSGLPPMLAMLQSALAAGVSRNVTLLFGAREEQDLYAIDEIQAIASAWRGEFCFAPVLSEAGDAAGWAGARGLVTEQLPALLEPGAHGYLCGPPAMIDGAITLLREHGVAHQHIYYDRFITQADVAGSAEATQAPAEQGGDASLADYLKYFAFHLIGLLATVATLVGGRFATAGLLAVVGLYMLGDAFLGDDTSTPRFRRPGVLTVQLWLALPLLALIVFSAIWTVCPGDPLGLGGWIQGWSGYDVFAARERTQAGHLFSIFVLTGLMIGMIGTITAHELTHRTWDPVSMLVGRWLLAFSFDTNFSIEHVYGHHRYVSTLEDPATAPRGRNVYFHIVASTIRGNLSAWKIEADRLRKKRLGLYSWHNAVLRGQLMSAALVAGAYAMGGLWAAAFFAACALWGKSLLEIVNYMEHYGMVRNPETPVQPRHSWNTNRRVSSWTMFNLTRHSHHHAQGEVPYHDLKPYPEAPMMISGYLTTIVVAMIPPLWHKLMTPKVLAWDRDYATAEELQLAARANAHSGMPRFASQPPIGLARSES